MFTTAVRASFSTYNTSQLEAYRSSSAGSAPAPATRYPGSCPDARTCPGCAPRGSWTAATWTAAVRPRSLAATSSQGQQNQQNWQLFPEFLQIFGRLVLGCIKTQENMNLTAFFKLYKICILLHRCNLKISAKNRSEKSAVKLFVKIENSDFKFSKILQMNL